MTIAAVLCCALAFTACQKPNADKNNDESTADLDNPTAQIASVKVEYKFQTTDDMLQFFDFKFEYMDAKTGQKATEVISAATFTKEYTNVTLPVKFGYNLTTTLKAGKTLDELKAVASMAYIQPSPTAWISMYDKNGKLIGDGGRRTTVSGSTPTSGERMAKRFEDGLFNKSYLESVDAKGNGTSEEWK